MEDSHACLIDNTKNSTASESNWELLAAADKLSDLPPYFLTRCPQHLRPGYLQHAPLYPLQSPTKGLSVLPAYIPENCAEDDGSMRDGDISISELSNSLITASSSNENEDKNCDIVSRQNLEHFRTIQEDLVGGTGNRPSPFQPQEVSTANADAISFAVSRRAFATFNKGTRRVGGIFVAPPQPLTTLDIDYDTEAESDGEDEAVGISAIAARPTAVAHNYFGGQSITLIEEVEATASTEKPVTFTKEMTTAANVKSYIPTHLICTICQDDLSAFWDNNLNAPEEDLTRHYEICWKERPRNPPNAPDVNTAQYMGTKNLCTISKAEAKKAPSHVSNPTHCASCNKDLVEMEVVDAVVHKVNCFHAYCAQQEVWMCPICHESIAGLQFEEDDKEYQRLRHVDCCNGIRIRNEAMAEKHLQLYKVAQGIVQRIDWATNVYRERYGKKPKSQGDRMRKIKDRFFLEKNKFPVGRSKLRNETFLSGDISTHAFGRSSQVDVLENLGLFQRSQFAVTHEELATKIVVAIEKDEAQRVLRNNLLAEFEQKQAAIKQMQFEGEKKVVEANRKWLASLREEQRLLAFRKEEDEQLDSTLEFDENLLDLSDGDSELSYINPSDLKASDHRDRSTSPEEGSDSDSGELLVSGATTPDELPIGILTNSSDQEMKFDGSNTVSDWATEVLEAMEAIVPSYTATIVTLLAAASHQSPSVDERHIPKNLLPSKAEAKNQRVAAKKAQRAQFAQNYAHFWAEEDVLIKSAETEAEIEIVSVLESQHESGGSLADDEASEPHNIIKIATPNILQGVDDNLTIIPSFKDLALEMKQRSRNSRIKEQRKHERARDKHEKKKISIQKRKQRARESAQTKTARLSDAALEDGKVGAFKPLSLQLRIHGLAPIVDNAGKKVREVTTDETEATEEELVILPLEVSAELICGETILLRIDSGTEVSSYLEEDNISRITEETGFDDAQKFVEPRGNIPTIAFVDKHIVNPIWTLPMGFMVHNFKPSTFLERMRTRARNLFSRDVE